MNPYFDLKILKQQEIQSHKLQGYFYVLDKSPENREVWKDQLYRNQCVKSELIQLGQQFKLKKVECCLLKGFSLMGDIYSNWGERFASDVDILIDPKDFEKIRTILVVHGYSEVYEKKWAGNNFKYLFYKKHKNLEIVIEVHTRLFWHIKDRKRLMRGSADLIDYKVLSIEEQLLHLCGHLGFQHNFLKLFWLLDIQLFLKKYEKNMDWSLFWKLAKKDEILLSCYYCLYLSEKNVKKWQGDRISSSDFTLKYKIFFLDFLISPAFLLNPKQRTFVYFAVKSLLKDKMLSNLRYWNRWIFNTIKTKG